nr:immunoglobulin heavy chain junction region [Mus musculus]
CALHYYGSSDWYFDVW